MPVQHVRKMSRQAFTRRGASSKAAAQWIDVNATWIRSCPGAGRSTKAVQSLRAASWAACVVPERLVPQIADVIDADDIVACITDWFIASDIRLAQDVGLSKIAFALRKSCNGFTFWVKKGTYRSRPVILLNVRCYADELVAALNKDCGRSAHFLLDLINQNEVIIHLG